MSIFGTIRDKIFGHRSEAAPATPTAPASGSDPFGAAGNVAMPTAAATPVAQGSTPTPAAPQGSVDVAAVLTSMAASNPQQLNWRQSIVDLMKLLGLDSSLANRQELAKELGYTGATDGSAAMNIWLHKQVMQKLAANGGVVPDDLKS